MKIEKKRRILIIDDNRAIHEDFRMILTARSNDSALDQLEAKLLGKNSPAAPVSEMEPFEVDSAYQGQEGWEKVCESAASNDRYAMAFVDMRMPPGWDGLQTIARIWEVDPDIQVVVCTAYSDYSWHEIVTKFGHVDRLLILKKPFDPVEVHQLACALTEKWHLARQASLKLGQLCAMVEERTLNIQAEIAERRESEEALRLSRARYMLAVAGANDGIWDWDLQHGTVFYSARWITMLGLSDENVFCGSSEWFDRIHPDDLERVRADFDSHIQGRSEQFHSEYRMRHENGKYLWILSRGVAVRDVTGRALRIAGSQSDITDRKLAEERLQHSAMYDALTGLANRALLMDRVDQCIRRTKSAPAKIFAVIFVDLDRFKVINESLGHRAGDQLLVECAARLAATVRDADTHASTENGCLARLGGDEFVLLLDAIHAPVDCLRVASRLLKTFSVPFQIEGQQIATSASLGIALSAENYDRPEEILRDADIALHRAKSFGRGCYQVFDSTMHALAVKRLWMENELRRAIEGNELRLVYQPILSLSTRAVVEVEALVRWHHPERGIIPPTDFIPLAEETGLIVPLGNWILQHAVGQLKQWETEIPELGTLAMAVNVSGRQLVRQNMAAEVRRVLNQMALDPGRLRLEITETTMMENGSPAMAELTALHDIGVQLHLDDFGTGYSSLSYLHRMPIGAVKIDGSFMQSIGADRTGTSIVQAIVALAHSLDIRVIAEGVETESQTRYLAEISCDRAQGFFFSKPLPANEIVEFIRRPENFRKASAA